MAERTPRLPGVYAELAAELARQNKQWGEQHHPDGTGNLDQRKSAVFAREWCRSAFGSGHGTWSDALAMEVAEANGERDPARLRTELLQVAAVAVAWAEAIDRRAQPEGTVPRRPSPNLVRELVEGARAQTQPAPAQAAAARTPCGGTVELPKGRGTLTCAKNPHPGPWHRDGQTTWKYKTVLVFGIHKGHVKPRSTT